MLFVSTITVAILATLLIAKINERARQRKALRSTLKYEAAVAPRLRISVVVSGAQSVGYISSLLRSESVAYQVVVVDDFARRETLLHSAIKYFGLFKVGYTSSGELPRDAVRGLYRSHRRLYDRLLLVDSPRSDHYKESEVGVVLSSYQYTLMLHSPRVLLPSAIDDLLLEIALYPEGAVDEIQSQRGERFKLLKRECALLLAGAQRQVRSRQVVKINYKILS